MTINSPPLQASFCIIFAICTVRLIPSQDFASKQHPATCGHSGGAVECSCGREGRKISTHVEISPCSDEKMSQGTFLKKITCCLLQWSGSKSTFLPGRPQRSLDTSMLRVCSRCSYFLLPYPSKPRPPRRNGLRSCLFQNVQELRVCADAHEIPQHLVRRHSEATQDSSCPQAVTRWFHTRRRRHATAEGHSCGKHL